MHIIWSKRAETDLYTSIGYIAEESPQNAQTVLKKITDLSLNLGEFPFKHPKEPIYNDESVRFVVIYSYKMVYKVYNDKIRILRLFHTKQHPKKI